MQGVLHIVDRDTPVELQRQLDLLVEEGEPIVSVGPAPHWLSQRRDVRRVPQSSCFLGWLPQASRLPICTVLHCWTGRPISKRLCPGDARIVVSLAALPAGPLGYHSRFQWTLPTPASARALIHRGMPATHVSVLPPAAKPSCAEVRQAVRRELGLDDEDILLLAMGDMVRLAGLRYTPWVHAILRQLKDRVKLVIPGHGPFEPQVRYFAGTTGYGSDCLFTGDRFALEECIAAADVGLYLPERDCGVGALVQAMDAGLPVVASRTPDVAWCAPHNEAAILVPPRSPRVAAAEVLRLIEDRAWAQRIGQAARERARTEFTIEHVQAARQEIYQARLLQLT